MAVSIAGKSSHVPTVPLHFLPLEADVIETFDLCDFKICLILNLGLGCDCQTVVIRMKNGPLLHQSHLQGIYQRAGKVNGKTSWISSSNNNAIWYDTDPLGTVSDDWLIGISDQLGGNYGGIASIGNQGISSCPYNVTKDAWKYSKNGIFIIADANDVSIKCSTGNDNFW